MDYHLNLLPNDLIELRICRTFITNIGLKQLPPNLLSLDLSECVLINGDILRHIPTCITYLNLNRTHFDDYSLIVLKKHKNLRQLKIRDCEKITEKIFDYLPFKLYSVDTSLRIPKTNEVFKKNIRSLTLFYQTYFERNFSNYYFYFPFETFTSLVYLLLDQPRFPIKPINLPPNLTHLNISFCDENIKFDYLPTSLIHLEFNNCQKITDDVLLNLPTKLESLFFSGCDRITLVNKKLKQLPSSIIRFNLTKCVRITCESIMNLPKNLIFLNLRKCMQIENQGLFYLSSFLTYLNLSHCQEINDQSLIKLPSTLTYLNLHRCLALTNKCVEFLPPKLKYLDMSFVNNKLGYGNCSHILLKTKQRIICDCDFIKDSLFLKNKLSLLTPNLRELKLEKCKSLLDDDFINLPQTISNLIITEASITDKAILNLPTTNLKHLNLSGCENITSFGINNLPTSIISLNISYCYKITNISIVKKLKNLTHIHMVQQPIEDDQIMNFTTTLTELTISNCMNITDNGIKHLPTSIVSLDLSGTLRVTKKGFDHLLKNLVFIHLNEKPEQKINQNIVPKKLKIVYT